MKTLLLICFYAISGNYINQPDTGKIHVKVIDSLSRSPIEGVDVMIKRIGYGSITDNRGMCSFPLSEINADTLCINFRYWHGKYKVLCIEKPLQDTTLVVELADGRTKPKKKRRFFLFRWFE